MSSGRVIFITGGARSGKSLFAEKIAMGFGERLAYVATARTLDSEMEERVRRHREWRGDMWETIEEPVDVAGTLAANDDRFEAILFDCVTLWITNLMLAEDDLEQAEEAVLQKVGSFAKLLAGLKTPVVLVTNEVGTGIVPENRMARIFRDIAGKANQMLAAVSDEAWLVVSGIPMKLK